MKKEFYRSGLSKGSFGLMVKVNQGYNKAIDYKEKLYREEERQMKLLEKDLKRCYELDQKALKMSKEADRLWNEVSNIQTRIEKLLRKKRKLPGRISYKVGSFRVYASVYTGYVRIKKNK